VEKKQQAYTENCKYDTIRYSIFTCAQKLTRWPAYLAHSTETKKNKENKIVAQKKPSGQQSVKAVREDEVKLRG